MLKDDTSPNVQNHKRFCGPALARGPSGQDVTFEGKQTPAVCCHDKTNGNSQIEVSVTEHDAGGSIHSSRPPSAHDHN